MRAFPSGDTGHWGNLHTMNIQFSVFIATSLDGFIARPDGGLDWLPVPGPEEDFGYHAFMDSVDCLVMGRKSFETVLAFDPWPYGDKRVIVLSATLDAIPTPVGGRVELFKGSQEGLVQKLAAEGVRRVYLDGGKTIQRFLRSGLVNDILITTIPILIGEGIPLFGPLNRDVPLTHLRTEAYPNGFVQSVYAVG